MSPSSARGRPGLATSVYAASEGLSVLALDCRSFGGQAGASARIENYLGFPTGISGMALMARAYNQAHKFGVETAIPNEVIGFDAPDDHTAAALFCNLRAASGCRHAIRRDRERRELPAARGRESRRLRRRKRPLLGFADRGAGCAPTKRSCWSAPAIRRARARFSCRARRQSLDVGASRRSRFDHVALSRRPDQPGLPMWKCSRSTEVCALEGADGILSAVHWHRAR